MNDKAKAWDIIGKDFWKSGRKTAKPSNKHIRKFSEGIFSTSYVCIVGASTKNLIEHLLAKNCNVFVYDFSEKMCMDLRKEIDDKKCKIELKDITKPKLLNLNKFDYVLNDRLINRFNIEETISYLNSCNKILKKGGIVRSSIKIGLYPMDEILLKNAKSRGLEKHFFNSKTSTINYEASAPVLKECVQKHGNISKEKLINWYLNRREEKRFSITDFDNLVNSSFPDGSLKIIEKLLIDKSSDTYLYTLKKRK